MSAVHTAPPAPMSDRSGSRRPELILPVAATLNGLLAVGLAVPAGQVVVAAAVAVPAVGAAWWARRRAAAGGPAALAMTVALVAPVLVQVLASPWPQWMLFNALLTLSLLPALHRPALVAVSGLALAGTPWLGLQAAAVALLPGYSAAIVVQALLLALVARRNRIQARERFDMEFLVRAMGQSGPIRLNLEVLRAESALGLRLKQVQERIAEAVRLVHDASQGVRSASTELASGSDELRDRTERSADGLRDAAMTLEQINVIVTSSAEAAREARTMAARATQQAVDGGAIFASVVDKMRDIDASSHKITDIIAVIDSLAFQTNILALNAAVEAARAGEQGRGFAVVAAEVRALALRSSQAAAQIKSLISESIDTVRSGTELVGHAGQRIEEIVASVRQVGDVFAHLSADTHEHAGSIGAVTEAVKELDQVTRQNVSVAESTRRIAQSLHEEGLRLEEVLGSFRVGQADGAARSAARPAARTEPAPAAQAAPDAVPQQTVTFF